MNKNTKCLVLGGGIAGVTTAIGLKKLGFSVTLFYKKRPFSSYEGFSQKTKEGLLSSGGTQAASLLQEKSLRNSKWASVEKKVNYEYVVSRSDLDAVLLLDAKEVGVETLEAAAVGSIDCSGEKAEVLYKSAKEKSLFRADFVVDARGRFTPFKEEYICGVKSFSLLQELEFEETQEKMTSISSTKDGWIWQAAVGKKKGYIQFTCDETQALKINNFKELLLALHEQGENLWSLNKAKPVNKIVKRDAYSKVHKEIVNEKMILVGDAASSIDPLSGNGAFQAMSMSSVAPFVVNTILHANQEEKEIAMAFYKERVNYIYEKFAKVGRDFYALEKRYETSFWQKRRNWPKEEKTEAKKLPRIEQKAVVKVPLIHAQEVVITQSNPMGVCFYGPLNIVELAKYCLKNSGVKAQEYLHNFSKENSLSKEQAMQLKRWLISQEIIKNIS